MKKKPIQARRRIVMWCAVFLSLVSITSAALMLYGLGKYKAGSKTYDTLLQYVMPAQAGSDKKEVDDSAGEVDIPGLPAVDFKALYDINPDIAGWLYIPETPVNYPIVQGKDNTRYLNHTFDGTENKVGCLYVDAGNTPNFNDHNTVVYGHNMLDKSMFSTLLEYRTPEYFQAHPYLYLLTPLCNYEVRIFSVYETNIGADSWTLFFPNDEAYFNWLCLTKKRSLIESEVILSPADPTITLSTCVNGNQEKRFVVVGKVVPLTTN